MKKIILIISAMLFLWVQQTALAKRPEAFAKKLCNSDFYDCYTVKRGQTWDYLFPDPEARDIVKRVNRTNMRLRTGKIIAVPKNLPELTIYDVAPFPRYIEPPGEKLIVVKEAQLAWAAYDKDGAMVWWGPISSGQNYCGDIRRECRTPVGKYRMIRKQGPGCVSTVFPRSRRGGGGAPMPYCMHFYRGFALHGSAEVPGHRASHGCIRLFTEDARWLNKEFIKVPGSGNWGRPGTRLVIKRS